MNRSSLLLGTAAVLMAAAAFLAKPAYRGFKSWRSDRLVLQSQALLTRDSPQVAFYKARTATLLDPGNIEAGRHLADLALQFRSPVALPLSARLVVMPEAGVADYERWAQASILGRDLESGYAALAGLRRLGRESIPVRYLELQLLFASGKYGEAEARSRDLIKVAGNSPEIHTLHVRSLLAQDDDDKTEQAVEHLRGLADRADNVGLEAQRALLDLERVDPLYRDWAAMKLAAHPSASGLDRFRTLAWGSRQARPGAAAALEAAVESPPDDLDPPALATIGKLLLEAGRPDLLLTFFSGLDPETLQTAELFRLRWNALIARQEVAEILSSTTDQRKTTPLSRAEELLFRARAYLVLGSALEADGSLNAAVEVTQAEDFAVVEEGLKDLEADRVLLALYLKAMDEPGMEGRAAALALSQGFKLGLPATDLLRTAALVDFQQVKTSPAVARTCAFLCLKSGYRLPEALSLVDQLVADAPSDARNRLLLAYALSLTGEPGPARVIRDGLDEETLDDDPMLGEMTRALLEI